MPKLIWIQNNKTHLIFETIDMKSKADGSEKKEKKKKVCRSSIIARMCTYVWPLKREWYNAFNVVAKGDVWLSGNNGMLFKECEHLSFIG